MPWAQPGTTLPNGMKISEREFMKTASQGMMCSPIELGISDEADGILVLGTEGETGQPLGELMPPDRVMVIETTTNRPDLLCHLGIARELSALLRRPVREPEPRPAESGTPSPVTVEIADLDHCARYQARHLADVTVRPAPAWMQRRLRAVGQKPISNVVDAANYVMFESGQPLHAFDAARLQGGIVVRAGRDGEEMACLDGRSREFDGRDLLIADTAGGVALAGVIGGADSAVSTATTEVVIESANFLGTSIRATSRRFALRTEASTRFEKQLSPDLVPGAAARLAQLLQEIAGAGPSSDVAEAYPNPRQVSVGAGRRRFHRSSLAMRLAPRRSSTTSGGCTSRSRPTAIGSLSRRRHTGSTSGIPVDLVEEVGRLRGYNALAGTLPGRRLLVGAILPPPDLEWEAREIAMGAAYDEVVNPLSPPGELDLGTFPSRRLRLANPMVVEQSFLRASLLPGLARCQRLQRRLGHHGGRAFELGRVFWPGSDGSLPTEARVLGLADPCPPAGPPGVCRGPSGRRCSSPGRR